ncbi:hypothetical protein NUU61_001549 [Penicillium alfredii]|uniref:Uncharacterized protein n=1 Tax=Penicillium alfredii TaxID=1506179 RepID=A0A9W9G4K0_9EURO|nr:uncharacterized protein NUU61_001549 [Penicillium alfredii]KAJ5111919.1 hypothetical protein NUU61_001549 [Penicillium alfredii]
MGSQATRPRAKVFSRRREWLWLKLSVGIWLRRRLGELRLLSVSSSSEVAQRQAVRDRDGSEQQAKAMSAGAGFERRRGLAKIFESKANAKETVVRFGALGDDDMAACGLADSEGNSISNQLMNSDFANETAG